MITGTLLREAQWRRRRAWGNLELSAALLITMGKTSAWQQVAQRFLIAAAAAAAARSHGKERTWAYRPLELGVSGKNAGRGDNV